MTINFDWKQSSHIMPNINDKIVAARRILDDDKLIIGKFLGTWNYGNHNLVYGVRGSELKLTTTISFGCSLIYDLPLTGFLWDYATPNFKFPDIKKIRKSKIEKIEKIENERLQNK